MREAQAGEEMMGKKMRGWGEKRNKVREREKKRRGLGKGTPKNNSRDLFGRWKGLPAKRKNEGRAAARCRGVGGKEPGETLGFEVRWALGRGWATLSRLKTFLFAK